MPRTAATALARASLREVNARLIAVERALTLNEGLPNRAWFKHQIYAPGFYTGYGVKTLPGGAREHRAEGLGTGRAADRPRRQGSGEHRRSHPGRHRRIDARGALSRSAPPRAFQMLIQMAQAGELSGELGSARRTWRASRTEVAATEEIALRDYRRAHRTVFVSALRPG